MSTEKFRIEGSTKNLIVYENKVVLEGQKVSAFSWGSRMGAKTFMYESISSIAFKEATLAGNGFLDFNITGDSGSTPSAAFGLGELLPELSKDNRFEFRQRDLNDEMIKAKNFIEDQMMKAKKPTQAVINNVSAADELRKFKQLLDDGIISQAEFDEKKKQLL